MSGNSGTVTFYGETRDRERRGAQWPGKLEVRLCLSWGPLARIPDPINRTGGFTGSVPATPRDPAEGSRRNPAARASSTETCSRPPPVPIRILPIGVWPVARRPVGSSRPLSARRGSGVGPMMAGVMTPLVARTAASRLSDDCKGRCLSDRQRG
jgi:hypothetical protein